MKKRLPRALAAILALMLASCTATSAPTQDSDIKTLRIGIDSDILKLDPAYAYDFTTNPVINQITQGLLFFDPNNQLSPHLASSWSTQDNIEFIFQIRDDVVFSDGAPMQMEDVAYSLNRHLDPNVASLLAGNFARVESIEQTGEWELTIRLSDADATFANVLGGTTGHIVQKAFCEEAGSNFGSSAGGLIGTGPYKYSSGGWLTGTSVVLERNENYWNEADAGYYDVLEFLVIKEEATRVNALANGDVDVLTMPPASLLEGMYADSSITMLESPSYGLVFMAFNHAKEPFDNPLVHKAIAHGIDFATIASTLVKRAGSAPTSLPFSLDMAASEPARWAEYLANAPVYSYNPEKAKELLSEAGYESGLEISLMTNEDGLRNSICLAIQEQLDAIGVKVNINRVSGDEHTSYQFGEILDSDGLRAYDILMAGWSGDYPDISSTLQPLYLGGQTANAAAYSNAALNELIEEQLRAVDPSQRNTVLMQAIDIITEEMPYLVVFYPTRSYAVSNKVTGIGTTANWFANVHFQDARPAK